MKLLIILVFFLTSLPTFAGSLNCSLRKGSVEYPIVETTEGIDEEEESETYAGFVDKIRADILYLPYQEGIYLHLTDMERNIGVSSVGRTDAELTYEPNGHRYSLICFEDF